MEEEVPCLYKYSSAPLGVQYASAGKIRCHLVYTLTKTGCKTSRNFFPDLQELEKMTRTVWARTGSCTPTSRSR